MSARGHVLLAVFACALFGACDDAPPPSQTPGSTPASAASVPKGDPVPREMVAAVPAGKTGSGLSVHFALRASPQVGQSLPVDIAIVPRQEFNSLRAHFEPQGGLTLVTGKTLEPVADVAAEKLLTHKLVLEPHQEGLFMVTAVVDTGDAQGSITRVFFIPVMVGPAGAQPAPAASPEPATSPSAS
jgi:hypothetical protein